MADSPGAARRLLGAELRRLRQAAGRSTDEAAASLECSQSKISRLENGLGPAKLRDVRDLISLYGQLAERYSEQLLEWAEIGQGRDWFDKYRDVFQDDDLFPESARRYVRLEEQARAIRNYELELIPGLLQCEEYIEAVALQTYPGMSRRTMARLIEFRIRRRAPMYQPGDKLHQHLVVNELAVLRRIGGIRTMLKQMNYLVETCSQLYESLELRILPVTSSVPAARGGPFVVLEIAGVDGDDGVVYLEGREGAVYLRTPEDTERYLEYFGQLLDSALSRTDTIARIRQEIQSLEREAY